MENVSMKHIKYPDVDFKEFLEVNKEYIKYEYGYLYIEMKGNFVEFRTFQYECRMRYGVKLETPDLYKKDVKRVRLKP